MAAIRVGFGEGFQPAFSNGLPDVVFQSAPPAKGAIPPTLTIWERDRYTRVFANPVQSENAKICPKLSKNWMIES